MFFGLETEHHQFATEFEKYGQDFFGFKKAQDSDFHLIWDSMNYSFSNGGKRFRPFLVFLIAQIQKKSFASFNAWAMAIEMIHTYSLIHDDLPCMDNDDYRRGQLTNHKKFGEDMALLAGDALQTEAYGLIASDHQLDPLIRIKLIHILSANTGVHGMVGGQVLDMKSNTQTSLLQLEKIHQLKTGCLIKAAVVGAALISEVSEDQLSHYEKIGTDLGLAFQIKDDLLDGLDKDQDHKSYLSKLGQSSTEQLLNKITQQLFNECDKLSEPTEVLKKLIHFNLSRNK